MGRVGVVVVVVCAVAACGNTGEDEPGGAPESAGPAAEAPVIDAAPVVVDAAPVVLDELAEWAPAAGDTITVHAADADGNALRMLLVGRKGRLLTPAVDGVSVTGRVSAASVDDARAALIAAYPALAPVAEPAFATSRSTRIDLRFARANAVDLFRILADVYDKNIVVVAEDLPDVSVAVRAVPVNSFLDAYAAVLGARIDRNKYAWFVRRPDDPAPDDALLNIAGPKITVRTKGARAGEVAALVNVLHPSKARAPCDKGPQMELTVKRAPAGTALAAASARAGVAMLDGGPSPCQALPLEASPDASGTLVAIAVHRKRTVALFRIGSRVAYVEGETTLTDGTDVRVLGSMVKVAGKDVYLYPEWLEDDTTRVDDATIAKSRLAATIVDGENRHAIIELPSGEPAVLSTNRRLDARVTGIDYDVAAHTGVSPGRLTLGTQPNNPELTLRRK